MPGFSASMDGEQTGAGAGGAAQGAMTGAMMGGAMGNGPGAVAGAAVGLGMGLLAGRGAKKAKAAQEEAIRVQQEQIRAEMTRRGQAVGATRQQFGDVWSMGQKFNGGAGPGAAVDPSQFQDKNKTLQSHAMIAGGIEDNAAAVRDMSSQQLTGGAQAAQVAGTASVLNRGLLGSSLDEANKAQLLAQYAGGRANIAGATEDTRDAGNQAVKQQQLGMESMANQGGDIGNILRSTGQASAIQGAMGQMAPTAFGNLLNAGMGYATSAAAASAKGSAGFDAFGLPSLTNKFAPRNRAAGGSTSGEA